MTTDTTPIHNYYLAALPDPATAAQMEQAWRQQGSGEKFRAQSLHMTLLEFRNPEIILEGLPRMERVIAGLGLTGFNITLDRLMTFGGRPGSKALVLTRQGQNPSVAMLAKQLQTALKRSGLQPESGGIAPHVTLAYGPGFAEARMLDTPILWQIDRLTLVDSVFGQGRMVSLAEWPLP
jgi:2'-5' RNA ligase